MKDILGKLTEIEASAPKAPAGKKMLTEDSVSPPEVKTPSLKDLFNQLSENVAPGQKPLPVLDPQKKQAGMGFVTSNNPSIQNILKNLDPKDVQIVQAPAAPGTPPAQPAPAGATGQPQQGQMQMKEKDEGKPGKNFAKIAKSAGKRYGSKEAGERVAGAVRAKLAKQGKLEEEQLDELSNELLDRYGRKASSNLDKMVKNVQRYAWGRETPKGREKAFDKAADELKTKGSRRVKGKELADKKYFNQGVKVPGTGPQLEEGKWDYPEHMKKTVTTSDMGTTNAQQNREERKAFRKKERAKAHAELMKGGKKVNEANEAKTHFDILDMKLIDQIAQMNGAEVDPDAGTVSAYDGNTVRQLLAFAQKYPNRLKKSSVEHRGLAQPALTQPVGGFEKMGGPEYNLKEGAKVDRMVKHIEKSERKLGKSKDEAEDIAWATANKRGMLDNKNKKKVKEGDIPSTQGIDNNSPLSGSARSMTTLEGIMSDMSNGTKVLGNHHGFLIFLPSGHVVQPTKRPPFGQSTIGFGPDPIDDKEEWEKLPWNILEVGDPDEKDAWWDYGQKTLRMKPVDYSSLPRDLQTRATRLYQKYSSGQGPNAFAGRSFERFNKGKTMKNFAEGKWNYPEHMKKTVTTSDMGTTNAQDNRDARREFRKKEKAKAHAELMKGGKKVNEANEAETHFAILDPKLIDQISQMSGAAVEPDTNPPTVSSYDGNTVRQLLAFAQKYPDRLKKTQVLHRGLAQPAMAQPVGGFDKMGGPEYNLKEGKKKAKPDFLDMDKDGNKKESMKKAAADKKKKKVDESINHRISAARLEGKTHGLRGHAYHGKAYDDIEEMKAYHDGYKEGMDELYEMGMYETAPAATVPGMASQAMEDNLSLTAPATLSAPWPALITYKHPTLGSVELLGYDDLDIAQDHVDSGALTPKTEVVIYSKKDWEAPRKTLAKYVPQLKDLFDVSEGNAFTDALAKTPKGGKFSVGGKTFTDTSSLEEYAFESKDLDEAVFNPMGGVARELRGLKGIVKDTPHAQLPGLMGAGAGAAAGIPAAATAGAVGAAFLPIVGASALGGYGLLKAGQLTGKVLNFLAQKLFGTKEEALAFTKAHLEAAKAGETSFQHNGKTYKVSLKPGQVAQLQHDIDDLTSQIKNKQLDKPDTMMGKIGAALKEDPVFESWDSQLSNLLNESEEVNEGLSVSVSKGNNHGEDSVNINATGPESEELLRLVKHAGLGLFGDEEHHEPSSAMSIQPAYGEPDEVGAGGVDVEVVDGHDGIMGLMQKLSGIQAAGEGDEDYKDEEDHEEEACNECGGMMEAGHNCGSKMDEEQTPDQLEAEVAEDNAPDSGAEDSVADEDAEAKEDAALAGADSGDEEEMNESFAAMLARLDRLAEGSGDKPKHPEHNEKDDKDYDDAEEELDESEQLDELSPELLDRAEDKAYDQYMNLASKAFDRGQSVKKDLGYGHYTKDVDPSTPLGKAAIAKHQQYKKFGDAGIKAVKRDQARADLDHVEANTSPAMRRKLGLDESELNEWANQVGKGPGKGTDASFEQDIEFMTKVIAGGLNKPKSTGQTTVPVIAGQEDRMHDNPQDWATLAGIKK